MKAIVVGNHIFLLRLETAAGMSEEAIWPFSRKKADPHSGQLMQRKMEHAAKHLRHVAEAIRSHPAANRSAYHLSGHKINVHVPGPHNSKPIKWRIRPVTRGTWHGGVASEDDPDINHGGTKHAKSRGANLLIHRTTMGRNRIEAPFHDRVESRSEHNRGRPLHQVAQHIHNMSGNPAAVHAMAHHLDRHGHFDEMTKAYEKEHNMSFGGKPPKVSSPRWR